MSSPTSISEFAENLPQSYRDTFTPAEIAKHAYVASKLNEQEVVVGLSLSRYPGISEICVCAPDRPGLLSAIFSALASLGYDVAAGEAFCYVDTETKQRIALDLFSIVDPQERVSDGEAQACAELLREVLGGRQKPQAPKKVPRDEKASETTVRFVEDQHGSVSVLEVETTDASGLLWAITHALHQANIQIVESRIRTTDGSVLDQFTLEDSEGKPISDELRFDVQIAVLTALDEFHRSPSQSFENTA